jgi:hypothetical protein
LKLHSPAFERNLRRSIKRAVKSSRTLRKQSRATNKPRNYALRFRPFATLAFAAVVGLVFNATEHVTTALGLMTVWTFGFFFIQAQSLRSRLYAPGDLQPLFLLPFPKETIFQWEFQKFFRASWWLLADLVIGYSVVGCLTGFSVPQWFGGLFSASMTWGLVVSLAILAIAYRPQWPYQMFAGFFVMVAFAFVPLHGSIGRPALMLLDSIAPQLNLLLPTGWPASLFEILSGQASWKTLGLFVPMLGIFAGVKPALASLRAGYHLHEVVVPEASDIIPGEDHDAISTRPSENLARLGLTEIEELIQSRAFLRGFSWLEKGPLERWLWAWLSPREKVLAEFAFPGGVRLSSPWVNIARSLTFAALAASVAKFFAPAVTAWVLAAGGFILFSQVLTRIAGTGVAFRTAFASGGRIPLYSAFPVGYRELGTFFAKYSAIQSPLVVLFGILSALVVAFVLNLPINTSILVGAKVGLLLPATRWIFITFSFSGGTNDTSRWRFRNLLMLLGVVVAGMLFLGLSLASLALPYPSIAVPLLLAAMLSSYGLFRLYGWFYHRRVFDLIKFSAS